jgi:peptidyl-prolyl cis-trans isomerase SurA
MASDKISLIKNEIDSGLISFDDAVIKYSEDNSKNNSGLIINPSSGSTDFTFDELDPSIKYIVQNMNIGEITSPSLTKSDDGSQAAYRLIRLNNLVEEHKANITNDFNVLKEYALSDKKQKYIDKWIVDNINDTYIQINENFSSCSCYNKWIK